MLYGKWRPQGFDEVVGQDHIVTTLRNALATGQVAHAYLFSGPRGTGKTTTARILARAVNCARLEGGEPCNACDACRAIANGSALDLIEMDAASNRGIDDVRELREKIAFAPSDLKMKVYLLDEVHMLTTGAFNALLKTLEEPPPHAIFILATTELHDVPATIISRCQRYDFRRVQHEAIVQRLRFICDREGFNPSDEGLGQIATVSRGGMRDAITLLEQTVARYGPNPSTDDVLASLGLVHDERSETLARALVDGDLAGALDIARAVADDGIDVARFTRETINILRELLPHLLRGETAEGPYAEVGKLALAQKEAGTEAVARAIQELAKADFRLDPASPLPLEIACAAAILAPAPMPVAAGGAVAAAQPASTQGARRAQRPDPNGAVPDPGASREERFLRTLSDRCKMVDIRVGAILNGSCEVISIDESEFELGFYYPVQMGRVSNEFRPVVEAQASEILKRPVQLKVRQIQRDAQPKRPARSGHLADVARSIGATPVGKDS